MTLTTTLSAFWRRYGWSCLTCSYGIAFLITLRVAYLGQLPNWFVGIPHYDKPLHVLLYAIASYLGHRLLQGKRWTLPGLDHRLSWPLFPLAFAIFTTVEELAQGLSPNRSLDAIDLVCSLVGCWLGYYLAERSLKRQRLEVKR